MDARRGEVDHAIEHVRPWHQDHARADGDQAQRGAELVSHRDRANDAGEQCRAEWLQQDVAAVPVDDASQNGTARRADDDERDCGEMLNAEQHRQCSSAGRGRERGQPRRRRWRLRDRPDRRPEGGRRDHTGMEVGGRPHGRNHTVHVDTGRIGRLDQEQRGVPVSRPKLQLAPASLDAGVQIETVTEPLGRRHRLVGRLAIDVQHAGETQNEFRPLFRGHRHAIVGNEWHDEVLLMHPAYLSSIGLPSRRLNRSRFPDDRASTRTPMRFT
jgi:hypothetical protein